MTCFNSLGKRLGASLGAALLLAVACAQVDRGYDSVPSGGSAGTDMSADAGEAGEATGGKAGSGHGGTGGAGHAGTGGSTEAGEGGGAGAPPIPGITLTVALDGTGTGSVTSDPVGIDCGATCAADFAPGTQVTLTATPMMGSLFSGWKGGGCSGTGTCVTTVAAATTVTATFTLTTPALTVVKAGTGTGTVTSDLAGISCGALCSAVYDYGTSVTLTAVPAADTTFVGWSGGLCTGTAPCIVPLNGATSVTATFTLIPVLTVTKTGAGAATSNVQSAPAGIDCGATCSAAFALGSSVVLTATPGAGYSFTGWTGGGCTGTGTCTIALSVAASVAANFVCGGSVTLQYTGALASFTVPACATSLTIEAFGAQGGGASTAPASPAVVYPGGAGARMKGTFALSGGTVLKVLVGGKGIDGIDNSQQAGGSGGGGTFVGPALGGLYIAAGGGGGAGTYSIYAGPGVGGTISSSGTAGAGGQYAGGSFGTGGAGNGNTGYNGGTGGGGYSGNGGNSAGGSPASFGTALSGGVAFTGGGAGGAINSCAGAVGCIVGRAGGFGGGGAAGFTGGGGGGYAGGGAGDYVSAVLGGGGGGGGSYNAGTLPSNTAAINTGAGKVIFSW